MVSVGDVYDPAYPSIEPSFSATRARSLMREKELRMLPVVEKRILRGVLYRSSILAISSSRSDALVKDLAAEPSVVLEPNDDLRSAVNDMLKCDEWYAPVVSSREAMVYSGVLGLEHVLRKALEENWKGLDVKVEEAMSKRVIYVRPDDNISKLWRLMQQYKYAGFPVVDEKGKVVGVVTQGDLLKRGFTRITLESESGRQRTTRVREVMVTPPITVKPTDTLAIAAEKMLSSNIGRLIVVNDRRELLGIIDREDIVKVLMG